MALGLTSNPALRPQAEIFPSPLPESICLVKTFTSFWAFPFPVPNPSTLGTTFPDSVPQPHQTKPLPLHLITNVSLLFVLT